MRRAAIDNYFKTPEFLAERKQEHAEIQSEIRGAERAVEWIYERGEEYPGEISKHLSDLDELRTREWFAGCLVSFIETGKMPPGKRYPGHTGQVTDLMIERARAYPIARLIEVKRGNRTHCISPEHDDRNPSMDIRNNFCYCYACGFQADSIKAYQVLHGCTFPEAVRRLNV